MGEQMVIRGAGVAEDGPEAKKSDADRPDWDDYWISIAEVVKRRSNDPDCQVGAVIVTKDNILISTGYNGFARGVQHHERRLAKKPGSPEKLRWMCHAEQNAIYNAARVGVAVEGAKIYTTKFPCLICTNAIVQAGIVLIHTRDTKTYDDELVKDDGSRVVQVLLEAGVKLETPKMKMDVRVQPISEEAPALASGEEQPRRQPLKVRSKRAAPASSSEAEGGAA